jgi:hypothetical protein
VSLALTFERYNTPKRCVAASSPSTRCSHSSVERRWYKDAAPQRSRVELREGDRFGANMRAYRVARRRAVDGCTVVPASSDARSERTAAGSCADCCATVAMRVALVASTVPTVRLVRRRQNALVTAAGSGLFVSV